MESSSRSLQYDEVMEDLSTFVGRATALPGLVAVILYGSYGRGDFGGKSDVDLYVLFDKASNAESGEEAITKTVVDIRSFMKPIVDSVERMEETEPSLLQNIFAEGKVLYWKGVAHQLRASSLLDLAPWLVFTYELSRMDPAKKSRIAYALYGKREGGRGLVRQLLGRKLGRGAFMIPESAEDRIVSFFRRERIEFEKFRVWASK